MLLMKLPELRAYQRTGGALKGFLSSTPRRATEDGADFRLRFLFLPPPFSEMFLHGLFCAPGASE